MFKCPIIYIFLTTEKRNVKKTKLILKLHPKTLKKTMKAIAIQWSQVAKIKGRL